MTDPIHQGHTSPPTRAPSSTQKRRSHRNRNPKPTVHEQNQWRPASQESWQCCRWLEPSPYRSPLVSAQQARSARDTTAVHVEFSSKPPPSTFHRMLALLRVKEKVIAAVPTRQSTN